MPAANRAKRILLLEDDYWDISSYRARLNEYGAIVSHVDTVDAAIKALKNRRNYDGIVMDVAMKGTSGLELISWINHNYLDHPPILVHSHESHLEEIDLEVLNFHASERVTFARKARLMRGDDDRDYSYIAKFISGLAMG